MTDKSIETVVIFRTGQLFEIDLAAALLEEHGIPHYTQQQSSSGLTMAMPAAPSTGPGIWWNLLVPGQHAAEAQEILAALSTSEGTDPGVWGFKPRPNVKRSWKIYAAAVLLLPIVLWLYALLERFFK